MPRKVRHVAKMILLKLVEFFYILNLFKVFVMNYIALHSTMYNILQISTSKYTLHSDIKDYKQKNI